MSTRAILGIENEDGTILGAWQWCDGAGLSSVLNKTFNTVEKAMLLINEGTWSTMFTQNEMEDYEHWLITDLYKGHESDVPYHSYGDVLGVKLLRYKHHEDKAPVVYSSYDDAIGQDINFLYLFDKDTNKWSMHR